MKKAVLLFLGLFVLVYADIIYNYSFKRNLNKEQFNNYIVFRAKGLIDDQPAEGFPVLPIEFLSFEANEGEVFKDIEITSTDYTEEQLNMKILPQPAYIPLSSSKEPSIVPAKLYSEDKWYPERPVVFSGIEEQWDKRKIVVRVYPIQYNPYKNKVRIFKNIDFKIRTGYSSTKNKTLSTSEDRYAYVIITPEKYRGYFSKLSNWHKSIGIKDTIESLEDIYAQFMGRDYVARIREFIKWAKESWGIQYVLLGGDFNDVPSRYCYVMSVANNYIDTIPTDMYFSCLDGDWDGNNNFVYGEMSDDVDLIPEVSIGRLTFDNEAQLSYEIDKIIHMTEEPENHIKKVLLPAEYLWDTYSGSVVNNLIADIAQGYTNAKLYEDDNNICKQQVVDSLNNGFMFVHYAAHGNFDVISTGPDVLYLTDARNLTNGQRTHIGNAISCIVAAFDKEDCIVEEFMEDTTGGSVAWIGNTRYGWGSPPTLGIAEKIDTLFFRYALYSDTFQIGDMVNCVKRRLAPFAMTSSYWRWSIYEWTLFGDPAMPVPTEPLENLTVNAPDSLEPGMHSFTVSVYRNSESIFNAFVSIRQEDKYDYGYTKENGSITFDYDFEEGEAELNVVARNAELYKKIIYIKKRGPQVFVYPDPLPVYAFVDTVDSFFIQNRGSDTLRIDSIILLPSSVSERLTIEWNETPLASDSLLYVRAIMDTLGLENGIYSTNLSIYNNTEDSVVNEEVIFVKGNYPCIRVEDDTLLFSIIDGAVEETLYVYNIGLDTLHWGIEDLPFYVQADIDTGTLLPDSVAYVLMSVSEDLAPTGSSLDSFKVISNDPVRDTFFSYITVENYTPLISVSPDTLFFVYHTKPYGTYLDETDTVENEMHITNAGGGILKVDSIVKNVNWIADVSPDRFDVSAQETKDVNVIVNPDFLEEGLYISQLKIYSNADKNNLYLETVCFNVTEKPQDILVFPDTVDVDIKTHDTAYFYVVNEGKKRLTIDSMYNVTNDPWIVKVYPAKLLVFAGDTERVAVVIARDSTRHYENYGTIRILSDDADEPEIDVVVYAHGYTGIGEGKIPLEAFANIPDFTNSILYIDYGLTERSVVHVNIYDISGRGVLNYIEQKPAGYHTLMLNLKDRGNHTLSNGIYFVSVRIGDKSFVNKLLIMR